MVEKESEKVDLSLLGEDAGLLFGGDEDTSSVIAIESIEDILDTEKKEKSEEEDEEEEKKPEKKGKEKKDNIKDVKKGDDVEEEEEKEKDTTKDVKEDSKEKEEIKKESAFLIFAQLLDEKGVIDFDPENFEDSEEGLIALVENKVKKTVEDYKESLHPKIKELIENYEDGVPISSFLETEASIEDYELIQENDIRDNVAIQKDLVRESLAMNGLSQEQIEKKITRFIEGGVLEEEALDAKQEIINYLIKDKEQKRIIEKAKDDDRRKLQKDTILKLKTNIDKADEIIKGIKLTPKQKEQMYEGITKVDRSGKTQMKKIIEADPDFSLKVAYMALILNWDLSTIKAKADTKAASRLKDVVDSESKFEKNFSREEGVGDVGSKIDWDSVKRSLKQIK